MAGGYANPSEVSHLQMNVSGSDGPWNLARDLWCIDVVWLDHSSDALRCEQQCIILGNPEHMVSS